VSRVLGAFLGLVLGLGAAEGAPPEYRTKAECLLVLLPFVRWPQAARPDRAFELVVLGMSPFEKELDRAARTETVGKRRIKVRYVHRFAELGHCDAMFVCASEEASADRIRAWARANKVLTIADNKGFIERGVMVNLLVDRTKEKSPIRLAVNLEEIKLGGFSMDATFLDYLMSTGSIRTPEAPAPPRLP
jgi:hypothetical protein